MTIKILAVVLLITAGTTGLLGQINYTHTLKGRITYLSSGYKPVAGAQVEAVKGANPTPGGNTIGRCPPHHNIIKRSNQSPKKRGKKKWRIGSTHRVIFCTI